MVPQPVHNVIVLDKSNTDMELFSPAQQMALQQVRFTVARIAQTFKKMENRDPCYEFVAAYKVSQESKNGTIVGFTPA